MTDLVVYCRPASARASRQVAAVAPRRLAVAADPEFAIRRRRPEVLQLGALIYYLTPLL